MIPLGSCTMKLNATTEMEPVTWPEFADIHPFAPVEQAQGYVELIARARGVAGEITGYDAVSLQPNAGSQGELAGLLAIRAYHRANGDERARRLPDPVAARTAPTRRRAVMAGMQVVVVETAEDGNVDLDDLRAKVERARATTWPRSWSPTRRRTASSRRTSPSSARWCTTPAARCTSTAPTSTRWSGVARPGQFGADVSHLNLHKTFCIPHGGGGPGVGPVGVRAHLAPFLPNHPLQPAAGPDDRRRAGLGGAVGLGGHPADLVGVHPADGRRGPDAARPRSRSSTPTTSPPGSAPHYPVLYTGRDGLVAHECILDLRPITKATGVTVDDVAKRLIDYGFHAPTMSFPVAGTLMIEPTECEDLAELDRFCDAMIAIRDEIDRVGSGEWPRDDNPLRNAPHTAAALAGEWEHAVRARRRRSSRPGSTPATKYWPPVRRIDGAYGDRNLVCSCPPVDELRGRASGSRAGGQAASGSAAAATTAAAGAGR